jgi:hypothetical protein
LTFRSRSHKGHYGTQQKSSSLKLECQNEQKFGGKPLWKVLYQVSSKQNKGERHRLSTLSLSFLSR